MPWLPPSVWEFLKSEPFTAIAGLASVIGAIPFLYAVFKYIVTPFRIQYFNEHRRRLLDAERAHLRKSLNAMDRFDMATYWDDLLYTPLEAEVEPFELIPP